MLVAFHCGDGFHLEVDVGLAGDINGTFLIVPPVNAHGHSRGSRHASARIITTARRDIVRILDSWPAAAGIAAAYRAITALT